MHYFWLSDATTLSRSRSPIAQVVINVLAMWWFFLYTARRFNSPLIHLGLVFFLAFLPVRIIHATTIGPDSITIPLFVLLLFLFDRFLYDESSTARNAALLGVGLGLAVWTKSQFYGAYSCHFPPSYRHVGDRRRWKLRHFLTICALSLVFPSLLTLHSFWASSRLHGWNMEKHWLPKGGQPEMDYKDLLSVKAADLQLFEAPEMFKGDPSDRATVTTSAFGWHTNIAISACRTWACSRIR